MQTYLSAIQQCSGEFFAELEPLTEETIFALMIYCDGRGWIRMIGFLLEGGLKGVVMLERKKKEKDENPAARGVLIAVNP